MKILPAMLCLLFSLILSSVCFAEAMNCTLITSDKPRATNRDLTEFNATLTTLPLQKLVSSPLITASPLQCNSCHNVSDKKFISAFQKVSATPCILVSATTTDKDVPFFAQCFDPFPLRVFNGGKSHVGLHLKNIWHRTTDKYQQTLGDMQTASTALSEIWNVSTDDIGGYASILQTLPNGAQKFLGFQLLFSAVDGVNNKDKYQKYLTNEALRYPVIYFQTNAKTKKTTLLLSMKPRRAYELNQYLKEQSVDTSVHEKIPLQNLSPELQHNTRIISELRPAAWRQHGVFGVFCKEAE